MSKWPLRVEKLFYTPTRGSGRRVLIGRRASANHSARPTLRSREYKTGTLYRSTVSNEITTAVTTTIHQFSC